MDNVALLTPARLEASFGSLALSQVLPLLPAAALRQYHLLLHRQLSALSLGAYLLSSAALLRALDAAAFLAVRAALVARLSLARGVAASGTAAARAWRSRAVQALRRKMFYELALFVLGCGNSVFLVVFWPGWILVGAALLALRAISG